MSFYLLRFLRDMIDRGIWQAIFHQFSAGIFVKFSVTILSERISLLKSRLSFKSISFATQITACSTCIVGVLQSTVYQKDIRFALLRQLNRHGAFLKDCAFLTNLSALQKQKVRKSLS